MIANGLTHPAELSLERARSASVVGLHDVSVLFVACFFFSRLILLFSFILCLHNAIVLVFYVSQNRGN